MAPKPLIDVSTLNFDQLMYDEEGLHAYLPQRYAMRQLHGVVHMDTENLIAVGYRDVTDDEFWCEGHFPARPVFPGVLIVESIAQLCAFFWSHELGLKEAAGRAMLFGGIDRVKFRDAVVPGQRMVLVTQATEFKVRRSKYETQAIVDGKVVFAGQITGLLGPSMPEIFSDGKP